LSIDITEINGCKRHLVAELPTEELDGEIDRLARKYAREVKIPGFRPGKVPLSVVKSRFRSELRQDATHEIIERTWKASLGEREIRPLVEPHLDKLEAEPGSPLRFTLSFEVFRSSNSELQRHYGQGARIQDRRRGRPEGAGSIAGGARAVRSVESGEIKDGHLVTMSIDGDFDDGGKPIHDDEASCIVGDSGPTRSSVRTCGCPHGRNEEL